MKSRLSFAFVKSVRHSGSNGPDKYHDEHGLILRVRASGSKHWIWRGTVQGRRRELGLRAFPYVSLSEAREKALDYRRIARAGRIPAAGPEARPTPPGPGAAQVRQVAGTRVPQARIRSHRLPQAHLAKSKVRGPMGVVATRLRLSRVRQQTRRQGDHGRLWTVPAQRMKAQKEHRVPLSVRATAMLAEAAELRDGDLVFPSVTGRPMSDATLSKLIRELGITAVPHGFRSSFRDWCGDTGQPRELAEAALAHTIRNKAEAAYARTDLLDRRRAVMEAWSAYLNAGPD